METNKIEEAALGYCAKCSDITNRNVDLDEDECVDLYNGFIDGAKWAINEFLKDLWHPASEIPCEGKYLVVEYNVTDTIKDYLSFNRLDGYLGWIPYCKSANVTRWLYIDDLLPKKGD